MNEQQISECLKRNQIPCEPELPEQLECYFRLLNEWNRSMDLIAELPEEELLDRHFTDSLTVLKTGLLEDCETLIDVGTGAGFPGMVLALALPGLRVTLIDAQQKRLHFLQAVMEETGAGNITILHSRAEDGDAFRIFGILLTGRQHGRLLH